MKSTQNQLDKLLKAAARANPAVEPVSTRSWTREARVYAAWRESRDGVEADGWLRMFRTGVAFAALVAASSLIMVWQADTYHVADAYTVSNDMLVAADYP